MLHFFINGADVKAYDAHAEKLYTPYEDYCGYDGCPTRNGPALKLLEGHMTEQAKTNQQWNKS